LSSENTNKIRRLAVKSFYFRSYLFWNLPMGFLSGMRIKRLNEDQCIVSVPFKWINKNPFKSTFWAVLGMAGEMSTAALILQYTYKNKPSFSTLPLKCEADFNKKAIGVTSFICNDGIMVNEKLKEAIKSKKPVVIKTSTKGTDENSNVICKFNFTWSVKVREQ
tara:strand:- start:2856 stop:3347 length:492 start_codon:yes stop_codon:yes gene_type:complete